MDASRAASDHEFHPANVEGDSSMEDRVLTSALHGAKVRIRALVHILPVANVHPAPGVSIGGWDVAGPRTVGHWSVQALKASRATVQIDAHAGDVFEVHEGNRIVDRIAATTNGIMSRIEETARGLTDVSLVQVEGDMNRGVHASLKAM